MTTLQALDYSSYQGYSTYSPPSQKVSEAEYWEKYYNVPDVTYEWHNGYLEAKHVSDFSTYLTHKWFFQLLCSVDISRSISH